MFDEGWTEAKEICVAVSSVSRALAMTHEKVLSGMLSAPGSSFEPSLGLLNVSADRQADLRV